MEDRGKEPGSIRPGDRVRAYVRRRSVPRPVLVRVAIADDAPRQISGEWERRPNRVVRTSVYGYRGDA